MSASAATSQLMVGSRHRLRWQKASRATGTDHWRTGDRCRQSGRKPRAGRLKPSFRRQRKPSVVTTWRALQRQYAGAMGKRRRRFLPADRVRRSSVRRCCRPVAAPRFPSGSATTAGVVDGVSPGYTVWRPGFSVPQPRQRAGSAGHRVCGRCRRIPAAVHGMEWSSSVPSQLPHADFVRSKVGELGDAWNPVDPGDLRLFSALLP